jgi:hypothetical protein
MSSKRSIRPAMEPWLLKVASVFVTALCLVPLANPQTNRGEILTLDEAILLAKSNNRDLKLFGLGFDGVKARTCGQPCSGMMFSISDEIVRTRCARKSRTFMVQLWSTNPYQPLLKALLRATRVAYFQYVTSYPVPFTA